MVTIKHKVTLKTKVAQEETPETIESPKVTLKRKQPELSVTPESKQPLATTPKTEPQPVPPTPQTEKNSNTGKVIGGLVAVAAIIAGIFFFMNKENESDNINTPTEVIAQNTDSKVSGNISSTSGTANEGVVSEDKSITSNNSEESIPTNTEEAPTNNDLTASTATTKDNKVAYLPAKQNPATDVKTTKSEQSKSFASQVSKPSSVTSAPVNTDVEVNARRVIRGDFGNGQVRKDKLGSSYSEIQSKVNEMYRQGLVH